MINNISDLSVLVVDDSPVIRKVATQLLSDSGITETYTASHGLECLDIVRDEKPDLILLDLKMPVMDGIETLMALGETDSPPTVIICSSSDSRTLRAATQVAGMCEIPLAGVLEKPYTAEQLMTLAQNVLQAQTERSSRQRQVLTLQDILDQLDKRLCIAYQPKISLRTDKAVGVECLARWKLDDGNLLAPDAFVPLLENSGNISLLTDQVIQKTFQSAAKWDLSELGVMLGINVSADDIISPRFVEKLVNLTETYRQPKNMTVLEVTETKITSDMTRMLSSLTRLRLAGFQLSLDDFGCGTSTLQQLRQAPFTELKIDRQFIQGVSVDSENQAIVTSCVELGRNLGLNVIGEGVDSIEDLAYLREIGCNEAQGYFIARPMLEDSFFDWLADSLTACVRKSSVDGTETREPASNVVEWSQTLAVNSR